MAEDRRKRAWATCGENRRGLLVEKIGRLVCGGEEKRGMLGFGREEGFTRTTLVVKRRNLASVGLHCLLSCSKLVRPT